jgi:hypothetical protein
MKLGIANLLLVKYFLAIEHKIPGVNHIPKTHSDCKPTPPVEHKTPGVKHLSKTHSSNTRVQG